MAKRPGSASQGVAEAIAYAEGVVAGRTPAGRLARLACVRFLRDKAAADAGAGLWGFNPALVEAALLFAGQMPNIKGPEAGHPLRLMPRQKLVFANLFGFVERGTTTRRFRQAVVYVPRGNGKTTIAAPIGLYLTFVEGEGGAEGYAAAVTRDQARILFDAAQHMVRRSTEFRSTFGVGVERMPPTRRPPPPSSRRSPPMPRRWTGSTSRWRSATRSPRTRRPRSTTSC